MFSFRTPSEASLQRAKQNVIQYYTLVGIAEELPGFMQVLEHIAPRYFKSAHKVFTDNGKDLFYSPVSFAIQKFTANHMGKSNVLIG